MILKFSENVDAADFQPEWLEVNLPGWTAADGSGQDDVDAVFFQKDPGFPSDTSGLSWRLIDQPPGFEAGMSGVVI